jgi:hypothetical protein
MEARAARTRAGRPRRVFSGGRRLTT